MNFNVNFVVRPAKMNKSGYSPLEVSIIIEKERSVLTLPRKIKPKEWNQSFQMVEGEDAEAKEINEFINASRLKLFACQSKLMSRNIPVTIETVKDAFSGKIKDKNTSLVTLYQEHNEEYKAIYKADSITYTTYQKHTTTLKHLQAYLKEKYDRIDIQLSEINKSFVDGFWSYIRINLSIQNNTSVNYMKNLRKICLRAFNDGIIDRNPFSSVKLHIEPVDVDFLTMAEIKAIHNKDCYCSRLNTVKDIFVFCCFTGLAYIDVRELHAEKHLITDDNGNLWIMKKREKTGIMSNIPLLPIAKEILEKHNYRLFVPSNQKVNAYLKEIGTVCGIEKRLNFHCRRHSHSLTDL